MPRKRAAALARKAWANLAVVVLISSALANTGLFIWILGLASENRHRADENRAIILEQQQSRVRSCRANYESLNLVFKPFFRPSSQRTAKERADLATLRRTIKELKAKCPTQTQTKGT